MSAIQKEIRDELTEVSEMIEYHTYEFAMKSEVNINAVLKGRNADFESLSAKAAELAVLVSRRDTLVRMARMSGFTAEQVLEYIKVDNS